MKFEYVLCFGSYIINKSHNKMMLEKYTLLLLFIWYSMNWLDTFLIDENEVIKLHEINCDYDLLKPECIDGLPMLDSFTHLGKQIWVIITQVGQMIIYFFSFSYTLISWYCFNFFFKKLLMLFQSKKLKILLKSCLG